MNKYASCQEVEEKSEWEGGPSEFIFGYGFTPDDMPDDVKEAVTRLTTQGTADMNTFENWLYDRSNETLTT